MSYKNWDEYKNNKLAAKQADKFFKELIALYKAKADCTEIKQVYEKMYNSHLYKKHPGLYCQVLSDAYYSAGFVS